MCEYCNNARMNKPICKIEPFRVEVIKFNDWRLFISHEKQFDYIKITNCPMCGQKLEGVE